MPWRPSAALGSRSQSHGLADGRGGLGTSGLRDVARPLLDALPPSALRYPRSVHEGDQFILQQLSGRLAPGEQIRCMAYLTKGDESGGLAAKLLMKIYWAALSDTALHMIETNPSGSVIRVLSFERSTLQCMWRRRRLYIKTQLGEDFVLHAPKNRRKTSTHAEFIEALTSNPSGNAEVRRFARRSRLLAALTLLLAIGLLLAIESLRSPPAMTVSCDVASAGVVCSASLSDSDRAVRACWDLELTCSEQQPTEETRVCVDVQGETSTRILLQPEELESRGVCATPVRAAFHGLEVTDK